LNQTSQRGTYTAAGPYNQNITHDMPPLTPKTKKSGLLRVGELMISSCMRSNLLSFSPLVPLVMKATSEMQLVNARRAAKLSGI
jgi:hypothetical protein